MTITTTNREASPAPLPTISDALREYRDAFVALNAAASGTASDRLLYAAEDRLERARLGLYAICRQVKRGQRKVSPDAITLARTLMHEERDARGRLLFPDADEPLRLAIWELLTTTTTTTTHRQNKE